MANPQNWNRFSYVLNNPIRYNDPSGHRPDDPYDSDDASWMIALAVNLATSIPKNYWEPNETLYAAQANYQSTAALPIGHWNLCGDISLSMILETTTGRTNTLYDVYSASPSSRGWNEPTGSYTVGQQFAGSFPAGWSVVTATYGEVAYFEAGNPEPTSYFSNSTLGTSNISSADTLADRLAKMLALGHYAIVAITQAKTAPAGSVPGIVNNGSSNSTGHWVVVTGVSDKYVYINNPYTNRREQYTRAQFYASWRHSWVELIPPRRRSNIPE